MLEIHLTRCDFWKWSSIFFCLLKDRKFLLLFQRTKDLNQFRITIWKQTLQKLRTLIFLTSIISDLLMENHLDLNFFFTFNDRTLICLFVLINFEVPYKWSLKEQLKNPLQHLF